MQLLVPEERAKRPRRRQHQHGAAIRTILVADLVMSLDNVIAVAAAAKGNTVLLVIGLAISIPLVVFASTTAADADGPLPGHHHARAPRCWAGWPATWWSPIRSTSPGSTCTRPSCIGVRHWRARSPSWSWASGWPRARWLRRTAPAAAAAAAASAGGAAPTSLKRVLLAVDGSEGSVKAAQQLLALRNDLRYGQGLAVELLNVQRPVSGDVSRFVPGQTLEDYHQERGDQALVPARAVLDAVGLAHRDHTRVGEPGPTIAEAARELGCDMIVMGSRGLGAKTGALLGSVAQGTLEYATVPVLLVR